MSEESIKALLADKEALRITTKQIFSEIDIDASGFIERKEFGLCVDKLLTGMDPAPSEEEKAVIIKKIDVNMDIGKDFFGFIFQKNLKIKNKKLKLKFFFKNCGYFSIKTNFNV